MDGIMIQNTQDVRPNIAARSKITGGPRKALANIQNTHHSKTVTFDGTAAVKPASKISQLKSIRTITPASKQSKKLGDRPTSSKKGLNSTTPFKIFEDGQIEQNQSKKTGTQTTTKSKKKIDIYNDDIEYMPPCTDQEVELPMPDYLQRVCLHKPTYNISLPSTMYTTNVSEMKLLSQKAQTEVLESNEKILSEVVFLKGDENLNEFIEDSLGKLNILSDEDLFAQMESDESFSLEALDREIRDAGLNPPNW